MRGHRGPALGPAADDPVTQLVSDLRTLFDALVLSDRSSECHAVALRQARGDLASIASAVMEGGWCSGEGTPDPTHAGPQAKDAVEAIREFYRFREEVWNESERVEEERADASRALVQAQAECDRAHGVLAAIGTALAAGGVEVSAIVQDYPAHVAALITAPGEARRLLGADDSGEAVIVPFSLLPEGHAFVYDNRLWVKEGLYGVGWERGPKGFTYGDTSTSFTTAAGEQRDPLVLALREHPP